MKNAKLISIVVLAILTAIIISQNIETVNIKALFITISMPLAVMLAVTWLIGLVCGVLIPLSKKNKGK